MSDYIPYENICWCDRDPLNERNPWIRHVSRILKLIAELYRSKSNKPLQYEEVMCFNLTFQYLYS